MSLLIDALKKAEEAKHKAEAASDRGDRPADGVGPVAAPVEGPGGAAASAARNLFEVKTGRRLVSFPLAVGLVTTLASIAIGIYFWLQLNPAGPRLATPPPQVQSVPLPPPAATPPVAVAAVPATIDSAPPAAGGGRTSPPGIAGGQRPSRIAAPSRGSFAAAQPQTARTEHAPRSASTLPVVRKSRESTLPAALAEAWQYYRADRLADAARLYRRVLDGDPYNVDALNGLGAIAARSGRAAAAERFFRRSLAARPEDPIATAGLSALALERGGPDLAAPLGMLREAIAQRPDEAALHFALGNAFAGERRWAEAQSSYFRAYGLDKTQPDYLFNLGVSLDRLGQRALARRFYQEALDAAAGRPHAFDPAAVRARLASLAAIAAPERSAGGQP
ncbi:MAG: tetratricopeptide repeat protein [Rhodocyclaceae bacterium]|nr:tetratricopeptide repeat protein [Rhodocyclaceae bacterium]